MRSASAYSPSESLASKGQELARWQGIASNGFRYQGSPSWSQTFDPSYVNSAMSRLTGEIQGLQTQQNQRLLNEQRVKNQQQNNARRRAEAAARQPAAGQQPAAQQAAPANDFGRTQAAQQQAPAFVPLGSSGPQAATTGTQQMGSGALANALRGYLGGTQGESDLMAKIKALLQLQG